MAERFQAPGASGEPFEALPRATIAPLVSKSTISIEYVSEPEAPEFCTSTVARTSAEAAVCGPLRPCGEEMAPVTTEGA